MSATVCFDFRAQPKLRYYLALDPSLAGIRRVNKTLEFQMFYPRTKYRLRDLLSTWMLAVRKDQSAQLYQESYWADTIGNGGRLDILSKKPDHLQFCLRCDHSFVLTGHEAANISCSFLLIDRQAGNKESLAYLSHTPALRRRNVFQSLLKVGPNSERQPRVFKGHIEADFTTPVSKSN